MDTLKEFFMFLLGFCLIMIIFTKPIVKSEFAKKIRKNNTNWRYSLKLGITLIVLAVIVSLIMNYALDYMNLLGYEQLLFGMCMGMICAFLEAFGISNIYKEVRERI